MKTVFANFRGVALAILFLAAKMISCRPDPGPPVRPDSVIEMSLFGGGIYGGINPTTEDRLTIYGDGRVIVSKASLNGGQEGSAASVPPGEVLALVRKIASLGFFNLDREYDCGAGDRNCEGMKTSYPPAVPLEVEVRIDDARHRVRVSVFEPGTVKYPAKLDDIVAEIRELARSGEP
jgi:hypothetical protein